MGSGTRRLMQALLAVAVVGAPTVADALPSRSIGRVQPAVVKPTGNVADLPMTRIVGRDFVFLEKPTLEQHRGYAAFTLVDDPGPAEAGTTNTDGSLAYERFVGRHVRATAVEPHPDKPREFLVTFVEPVERDVTVKIPSERVNKPQ